MTGAEKKGVKEEGGYKMEIRLLDKNEESKKLSFVLKGTNTNFANLLRRYIVEKVPTMAIEEVEFKDKEYEYWTKTKKSGNYFVHQIAAVV